MTLDYKTDTAGATISATSTGASATVVYTCPSKHDSTLDLLLISNNNSSNKKISVEFLDSSASSYKFLVKDRTISANSSLNLLESGAALHLQSGDKIVASGETTNTMEVTVSVREYYSPNK